MKIRISSAAEAEFAEAASYYEQAEEGLGDKFISAVSVAVSKIKKYPALGKLRRKTVRSLATRKFPYNIVYEVGNDEIVIHAIAHQSRLPDYWIDRIS
jgi:plasmid stabilization system protein ParE